MPKINEAHEIKTVGKFAEMIDERKKTQAVLIYATGALFG